MPHFHWKKDADKKASEMVQVQDELPPVAKPAPLYEPPTATLAREPKPIKVECIACKPPRGFRTVGMMSMHFGKAHPELKKTKDSFREYMRDKE